VSALALVAALLADYLAFRVFDLNYFRWYLASGALIQLVVAGVAVAVDLEGEPKLISTHPGEFLGACFALIGESILAGTAGKKTEPRRDQARSGDLPKKGPLDGLFSALFDVAFLVLFLTWLIVIAPIQYFGNLVAGAPARAALASRSRMWVIRKPGVTSLVSSPIDEPPEGAEEIGLARRPVALTASITAGLLFGISYLV
jgi:hypothetical protein